MTIKNTIKNAIDYFYMEAPVATVSMKLDPDLQTKLIAAGVCRISGVHFRQRIERREGRHSMCARTQRSESHIHLQPRSTSKLSASAGDWLC